MKVGHSWSRTVALVVVAGWASWRAWGAVVDRRRGGLAGDWRRVQITTDIAATPERVWAVIVEPRKAFLTANPITRVELGSAQTAGVGTTYSWSFGVPWAGPRLSFTEVVAEWEEARRIAYESVSGWPMRAVGELQPTPSGTRYRFTLAYRLRWPWNLLIPHWLARLGVRLAAASLRRRAEAAEHPRLGTPVIRFAIEIAAPPAEVFRVVGEPRSKVVWVPAIRRVELHDAEPAGLGTRYRAASGVGPVEFAFEEAIVAWEPPHRLAYGGVSPWGRFTASWRIEPRPGGARVEYRMDYWFPGGWPGRLLGRLVVALVRPWLSWRSAARLTVVIEQRLWPPPVADDHRE